MKPSHLYWVSQELARNQSTYDKAGNTFAEDADEGGVAGRGAASADFAGAYDPLIQGYLELWARSVVSIGGASTGFTVTANNYRAADHHSNPKAKGDPPRQEPPHVIEKPPNYPEPSSVLFGGDDGDDTDLRDLFGEIGDLEGKIIEAVLEKVKGLTRLSDVFPWADADELDGLAETWRTAGTAAKGTGRKCDDTIAYITNSANDEWQQAMRQFTRSLWGTTAWGKDQGGLQYGHGRVNAGATDQPILEVLDRSATTAASSCESVASAVRKLKGEVKRILWDAVKATARELLDFDVIEKLEMLAGGAAKVIAIFLEKLDHEALDAAVSAYETALRNEVGDLKTRIDDIDEATTSAPTFNAEVARSQAYGARSLHEFRTERHYAVPGEDKRDHFFPIDLASEEGIHGSHPLDRHVGKTEEQLAQRLRDQPGITAASSFKTTESAQRLTQAVLDDVDNAEKIERWIARVENRERAGSRRDPETSTNEFELEFDHPTGISISRSEYNQHGTSAQAVEVDKVTVQLRYKKGLDPPFVVLTSMPSS
ncbi:RNase A-like domain-containing protein [Streptomyces sp. JJ36]|uniref:RNase A-like domain-containing protein n=1 Tax=Streptomyces sp. JJ36 TaxID=2736645 RepID=UPI001F48071F|nr:RNase A-like domain-containing protein [Streptomyces sp. JJ36]MCF6523817.1 hypothetical protein [Streptomyces sp. JJ36]